MRSGTTLNDFMQWDNTLFDGITLPSDIDHGILVSSIMLRCGLQNPVYEHYDVFKSQVHIWFSAHEWNFTRLVNLIKENYNPLWNKDGYEEREIDHTRDETESVLRDVTTQNDTDRTEGTNATHTGSETHSGNDVRNITETLGETGSETVNGSGSKTLQSGDTYTDTHQVKGFNASDWQDTDRTNHTGDKNETESTTNNQTTSTQRGGSNTTADTFTHGEKIDTNNTDQQNVTETIGQTGKTDDDTTRTLNRGKTLEKFRAYGNIGVTTSQAMFLEEVNLLDGFNLYDWIAKKFDDDLMLGVYTY